MEKSITIIVTLDSTGVDSLEATSQQLNTVCGKITKIVSTPTLFTASRDDAARPQALVVIIYYVEDPSDYKPVTLEVNVLPVMSELSNGITDVDLENTNQNATVLLPYATEEVILITARYEA